MRPRLSMLDAVVDVVHLVIAPQDGSGRPAEGQSDQLADVDHLAVSADKAVYAIEHGFRNADDIAGVVDAIGQGPAARPGSRYPS
jgi:hypothetical protein